MPKYCPICFGEFKVSLAQCPKHSVDLLKEKPKEVERLIDFYVAASEVESERILALLHGEKIAAKENTTGISQVPVVSDTRFIIAVKRDDLLRAKSLIERAKEDNVISKNGDFI